MRRIIVAALITLSLSTLAACSPYDPPAAAETVTTAPSCDRACWEKIKQRQADERLYWAEVVKQQKARAEAARIARIYAFAAAIEQARLARLAAQSGYCTIEGVRVCDGPGLLPHYIVWRESRMNPRARNPRSSAGGYAQLIFGTFRAVCPAEAARYGNAAYAPVAVQVECVRRLIARAGLTPWRL